MNASRFDTGLGGRTRSRNGGPGKKKLKENPANEKLKGGPQRFHFAGWDTGGKGKTLLIKRKQIKLQEEKRIIFGY